MKTIPLYHKPFHLMLNPSEAAGYRGRPDTKMIK